MRISLCGACESRWYDILVGFNFDQLRVLMCNFRVISIFVSNSDFPPSCPGILRASRGREREDGWRVTELNCILYEEIHGFDGDGCEHETLMFEFSIIYDKKRGIRNSK